MNYQKLTLQTLRLLATAIFTGMLIPTYGYAQSASDAKLIDAAALMQAFTTTEQDAIPAELLQRAHGIAVIPGVIRGGFILGGRRGRGIMVVRSSNGEWSNPAFIALTGGSIGWQVGAESADIVLVFANERSVANISRGKFTLSGDATAVAGPLGRHATVAVMFRAEVYGYLRSRGLFAGAAFEGARMKVDRRAGQRFYAADTRARPLGMQNEATPPSARRFLLTLEQAALTQATTSADSDTAAEEAVLFPLE